MENLFKLKENKTSVSTEFYAGLTTFMTMAYILVVNPTILKDAGMDWGGVFTATAVASFIACLTMALLANYPFALAPGMGLNAFFAYTIGIAHGWQIALLAVLVEGIIFILLSAVNFREAIFDAIPQNLKYAVSVGIGLFIAFIGLSNSGLVVSNPATIVGFGDVTDIRVVLTLIGLVITVVLLFKKIKGALFWGILITYIIGVVCQLTGIYTVAPELGRFTLIPEGLVNLPPSVDKVNIFAAMSGFSFENFDVWLFITVVISFLFVDVFDTIGTLIGVASKADFLTKEGKLPRLKQTLMADAVGTTVGAVLGTSTVTTYVESAAGVAEGGRTGLTAVVCGGLFLLSLFFAPIFQVIPAFATAPALIIVGLFIMESVVKIDFTDITEGFPAFLAIIMMPLTYNISEGLVFGVIAYVIVKLLAGKRNDVSIVMYIIALVFMLRLFWPLIDNMLKIVQ